MHLLLFLSPDWLTVLSVTGLSLLYKFTQFLIYFLFLSDEGPMLEMLDYTIRIGSTPTFLYFDLYLYSAYAAHYIYLKIDLPSAKPAESAGLLGVTHFINAFSTALEEEFSLLLHGVSLLSLLTSASLPLASLLSLKFPPRMLSS